MTIRGGADGVSVTQPITVPEEAAGNGGTGARRLDTCSGVERAIPRPGLGKTSSRGVPRFNGREFVLAARLDGVS